MPELITPSLDALGATGREFTQFFCASPVCSPARASFLTGRMPSAHGVHDWIRCESDGVNTKGVHYLEPFVSIPEILSAAGYRCAHSGKWHLGDAREAAPGFDLWFSHLHGGGPYYGAPVSDNGIVRTEHGYITDAISEHADDFLRDLAARSLPFFLEVNFTAPHFPWGPEHHPARLRDLYSKCTFDSIPRFEADPWFNWAHGELADAMRDPHEALVGFCASLTAVDEGVARLVSTLDELGVRENTFLIFLSDNGFSCGHHGIWGKGNGTAPLNMWEDSIRVPFFINRPGVIDPGLDEQPTSATALFATILDLAGVAAPEDSLRAGDSFAGRIKKAPLGPHFENPTAEQNDDPAIHIFDEYGGTRMIRTGRLKYVHRHTGPSELYDLTHDPDERHNLIDDTSYTEIRKRLHARLNSWFQEHCQTEYDGFRRAVTGEGQNAPVWIPLAENERYAPMTHESGATDASV